MKKFLEWVTKHPEIKEVSVFALAEDNLSRSSEELSYLWKIYREEFKKILSNKLIKENGVRVRIIGNKERWPPNIVELAKIIMEETKHYTKRILNLLLAYSSGWELEKVIKLGGLKNLLIGRPVDLLIRTGNQKRLSNFLLLQCGYAEIYFEEKLWPDITREDFEKWIDFYYTQTKNFGK